MRTLAQIAEQRRERRRPASGSAQVSTSGPRPVEIEGSLVDVSPSGFRLAHNSQALETGTIVQYVHAESSGMARVVWNRIAGDVVETGFFVVRQAS